MDRSVLVLAIAGLLFLVCFVSADFPSVKPTPEQLKEAQDAFARLGGPIRRRPIPEARGQIMSSTCRRGLRMQT